MAKKKVEELTKKELIFIDELIKDKTQRQAYLIAYPHTIKWKKETIDNKASKLFNRDEIKARYLAIRERLKQEAEEESIIDAKEILREYKKIAFADIKDFLEFGTETNMVEISKDVKVPEYTQVIKMKDSKEVDGTLINEISIGRTGTFKFKLHDKLRALNKLAQYVRLIRPEDEDEEEIDDGLMEQIEKAATKDIWEGVEDAFDEEEEEN
jgi:phage terminase small subunit